MQKFDGKYSEERICEVLQKFINDWDLIKASMVLVVRDNASNGALATRLLDIESFGCIAHSLHLVLAPLIVPTVGEATERFAVGRIGTATFLPYSNAWFTHCSIVATIVRICAARFIVIAGSALASASHTFPIQAKGVDIAALVFIPVLTRCS